MSNDKDIKDIWEQDNSFIAVCVAYLIVLMLFIALRVAGGLGIYNLFSDEAAEIGFSLVSQVFIMLFVPLMAMKLFSKKSFRQTARSFGFNRPSSKVIGFAFILGALAFFLNMFVAGVCSGILSQLGYRFPSSSDALFSGVVGFFISLVLIGVLPGVCEEANHRGMVLNGFINKLGVTRAVLLSSLIFGLMHLNVVQVIYTAVLGYFMAIAVLATRSIWTGVIIHFMNNGLNTLFSYAQNENWLLGDLIDPVFDLFATSAGFFIFIGFVFVAYYFIIEIIHSFARENYKRDEKVHLANFIASNPKWVEAKIASGESLSLEDMAAQADRRLKNLSHHDAILFYINNHKKPVPMTVIEKTLLFGVIFLGSTITIFTLVWGML